MRVAPTLPGLDSLAFGNATIGWAGGRGILLGTRDAGATWTGEWRGDGDVFELAANGGDAAWALVSSSPSALQDGVADRLLRTTDAGLHWVERSTATPLRRVAFATDSLGWAVVGPVGQTGYSSGRLEVTNDGGASWKPANVAAPVDDVCSSAIVGWAAGGSGVFRVAAGRWQQVRRGPPVLGDEGWVARLRCSGSSVWVLWTGGAAAGSQGYRVDRSLDGGTTWRTILGGLITDQPNLPSIDAYSGPFAPQGGAAAGFLGFCPACGAGSWSYVRTTDGGTTVRRAPMQGLDGASLNAIAFADPAHGWIAATGADGGGSLLASVDGGGSWHLAYPAGATWPAVDVSFVAPSIGFGLGVDGDGRVVLETRDAGRTWALVGRLPADPDTNQGWGLLLSFVDESHGWAATREGIATTVDGGRTWKVVPGAQPGGVAFQDSKHGCTGVAGTPDVTATSDGGVTWHAVEAGNGLVVCAAALLDPAWEGVAAPSALLGALGPILGDRRAWASGLVDATPTLGLAETADRGLTWTAYRWPNPGGDSATDSIARVSFASPGDGWVFTQSHRLYATIDGGASWVEVEP